MTVEIAILNKSAVALASDSAVTFGGNRIFNTGDKLFTLSKIHPVGIMVYQRIDLMGVPWETIIKSYRKKIGTKKFGTLQEYGDDFVGFLQADRLLFPEDLQKEQFGNRTTGVFAWIIDAVEKEAKQEEESRAKNTPKLPLGEKPPTVEEVVGRILNKKIDEIDKKIHALPVLECFKKIDASAFTVKHKDLITDLVKKSFEKFEVGPENLTKLINVAIGLFLKTNRFILNPDAYSGLVIAGFGDKEVFPSVIHYGMVEEMFDNHLKITPKEVSAVTHNQPVEMRAFAQPNFVKMFLNGIDPEMRTYVRGELPMVFGSVKSKFFQDLDDLPVDRKKALDDKFDNLWKEGLGAYYDQIDRYEVQNFRGKMGSFISALSKGELAAMAETFVQLTSFKVKITSDLESVGGPIDVAVISKGDGFIWVKRKHYFDIKYNPHFVENYMGVKEESDGQ